MNDREILETLRHLRMWRRRGMFAPHKPLLLLIALRRAGEGQARLARFDDWAVELTPLLLHFWHTRPNAGYPYWRLQHDGLWEVDASTGFVRRRGREDPGVRELRKTAGGLTSDVFKMFRNAAIAPQVERILLDRYFSDVQHADVRRRVGLLVRP